MSYDTITMEDFNHVLRILYCPEEKTLFQKQFPWNFSEGKNYELPERNKAPE
jgi:hypothetical protein